MDFVVLPWLEVVSLKAIHAYDGSSCARNLNPALADNPPTKRFN
jgi:hypothetical protein